MGVSLPPLFHVDAFTDRPFTGNPAAVCLPESAPSEPWMAAMAAEMNLAETAFCWPEAEAWRLRWFTPAVEVPLCGHATVATAHVMWEEGVVAPKEAIAFETLSGRLSARADGALIELDFPALPPTALERGGVAELSGLFATDVAYAGVEAGGAAGERRDRADTKALVELGSAGAVRDLRPDLAGIARLGYQGLVVTAPGDSEGVDYVLRFFAPNAGIPEDPVTGSAQCVAGPHWAARTGRQDLMAAQVSPRGGRLRVRVLGDRVAIAGHAVTVSRGRLAVEPG